jgi:membrane protein DedA with SNARE-associated domain
MSLESLVSTYGYAAVVLGTFIEGEATVLLGGFAARLGILDLEWVVLAAFAGTFAADQFYFYLGRHGGVRLLDRRPGWKRKADRVLRLLHRHQTLVILSFRFIYGIRTVAPLMIGASGVSRIRYLLLDAASVAVWATLVGTLGYLFGFAIERLLEDIRVGLLVVLLVLAVAAGAIYYLRVRSRGA